MGPVVTSEVVPGISVVPGAGDTSEEEGQGNEIVSVVTSVAVPGIVEVVLLSAVVTGTGATLVALGLVVTSVTVPETVEVVWSSAVVAGTGATLVALGRDEETDSVAVTIIVEDSVLVTELLPVDTSVGVPGTGDCEVTKVVPGVGVWVVPGTEDLVVTSVVPGTEL